jgi:hypothetical protein
MTTLPKGTLLVLKAHPDYGNWRITKTPTPREDWYHIRGESGEIVLFECELKFYDIVKRG